MYGITDLFIPTEIIVFRKKWFNDLIPQATKQCKKVVLTYIGLYVSICT